MATKFTKGQTVKLNAVIPTGPVIALRMDEDGNFFYLIEWINDGEVTQRWFEESLLSAA